MKLRVDIEQHRIRAIVEHGGREAVIRRWPWPKFCEACEYVDSLAAVMACPVEFCEAGRAA